MDIRKILVAIDFSAESEEALVLASDIASAKGAQIRLLHVGPVMETRSESRLPTVREWERVVARQSEENRANLDHRLQRTRRQGLDSSAVVCQGEPAETIVSTADEVGADLIVVGSRGHGGAREFLLGSVAKRVVRSAHCHVLVARPGCTYQAGARRVLAATDFTPHSDVALRLALDMTASDGRLDVVHFWNLPILVTPSVALASDEASLTQHAKELHESAERMGAKQISAIENSRVSVRFEALRDKAARGIVTRADGPEGPYDLVVVGSHGRRGFRRYVFGSVAESIVRHAPCSVLVARRREDRTS